LRYFQRQDLRPNIKSQPITWRPNANARANPVPVQNYGNQAGGGTVHYGTVSWRFHEDDFRARSPTIARYGASAIPADSSLTDWPLSYTDLEPYYDRAEYDLGVSGKAGNVQGRKIDGGNAFEAPRRREYPLPPLLLDQAGVIFDATAQTAAVDDANGGFGIKHIRGNLLENRSTEGALEIGRAARHDPQQGTKPRRAYRVLGARECRRALLREIARQARDALRRECRRHHPRHQHLELADSNCRIRARAISLKYRVIRFVLGLGA
jgi:choline dehydrogenase-like flavoprotein